MKKTAFLFIIPFLFACFSSQKIEQKQKTSSSKAQNVILLIGDGMGLSQVSSLYFFGNKKTPSFNQFPVVGLIDTRSSDAEITDSAAGATAFACGKKSYNGAISVDDSKMPIQTLVERLENRAVSNGIVATSQITHATPACYFAHQPTRRNQEAIAKELINSNVDFFAGGGIQYFTKRKDGKNLLPTLNAAGFNVDTTSLMAFPKLNQKEKYGYLLAPNGMPSKLDGRGDFLPNATSLALSYLNGKEKDGFFLMIEGSQIDWEGHASNKEGIIEEMIDFDKTIEVVLDFAKKNENTLVIVTADHETGGFALQPKLLRNEEKDYNYYDYSTVYGGFYEGSTETRSSAHTATLIPVFAYGSNAEKFGGIYDNTAIFHKITECTGW